MDDTGGATDPREAPFRSRLSATRDYVRSRAPSLAAMLVCAAVATFSAAPYPAKNEDGMLTLLSSATDGTVASGDFVWEPSNGFLEDLLVGRRVLYLSKKGPDGMRDLYRARVTVTRQGRPMRARSAVNLSATDLADERDLVVNDHAAAVSSVAFGRVQSVRFVELSPQGRPSILDRIGWSESLSLVKTSYVSFSRPPTRARYEIQANDLVLSLGDEAESAVMEPGTGNIASSSDRFGAYFVRGAKTVPHVMRFWDRLRCAAAPRLCTERGTPNPPLADLGPLSMSGDTRGFPPGAGFEPLQLPNWPGSASPVHRAKVGTTSLFAIDMRQLRLKLELARDAPRSQTGHYPKGEPLSKTHAVLAIVGPSESRTGGLDSGIPVAPFFEPMRALADDGAIAHVGTARLMSTELGSILGFPAVADTTRRERASLCATRGGHFVYVWGSDETPQSMQSAVEGIDCAVTLPIEGPNGLGMAFVDEGSNEWSQLVSTDPAMSMRWENAAQLAPLLLFSQSVAVPSPKAPHGADWTVDEAPQPDPTFAPAIYHSSVDSLGTNVQLRLFMPGRFDWVIRAGEKEKTHRLGGSFVKALDDSERARAFFATGLGIGKRRAPLGLRISDSTGHAFHHQGGRLEAGPGMLFVGGSTAEDPTHDASEVLLTASGGSVLPAARERGPREARADLCVLDDGTVLYAQADFDSHEATAGVLVDLGCSVAVGLDRGAEQPAWFETGEGVAKGHDSTSLFALSRPSRGSVTVSP